MQEHLQARYEVFFRLGTLMEQFVRQSLDWGEKSIWLTNRDLAIAWDCWLKSQHQSVASQLPPVSGEVLKKSLGSYINFKECQGSTAPNIKFGTVYDPRRRIQVSCIYGVKLYERIDKYITENFYGEI